MGTHTAESYVSLLRIKQQHGCSCETGPKKRQQKKQQCVSKQTAQLYTESSTTLSPHTMWSSGDDRPGMEFNFTSLFPFSPFSFVTHRQDAHIWLTPAHIQKSNLRLEKAMLGNMAFRNDKNREKQLSKASHIGGVRGDSSAIFPGVTTTITSWLGDDHTHTHTFVGDL